MERSTSAPCWRRSARSRESIRVPAEIVARPGGAAQVVAPVERAV